MQRHWKDYLFVATISFFILGLFNIIFAWFGFACLTLPFILLIKNKRKTWCQGYCPRASLFDKLFQSRNTKGKPAPDWLFRGDAKQAVFIYFIMNLFILAMSTIMVFKGRILPVGHIRFLMAFQIPWDVPQLLSISGIPDWAVHLSFRIYSMMFTTTIIGLFLGWIFKPRTWCAICPINTASEFILRRINNEDIKE